MQEEVISRWEQEPHYSWQEQHKEALPHQLIEGSPKGRVGLLSSGPRAVMLSTDGEGERGGPFFLSYLTSWYLFGTLERRPNVLDQEV